MEKPENINTEVGAERANNPEVGDIPIKATGSTESIEESEHAEAVAFVEKHRDFLEHYAKGRVKISPAPKGIKTFGFNLETDEIYVNSMFYKNRGFGEEKTLFGICHEIEHFLEKKAILSEEGGERVFERYLKRIKTSRAFSLMDNCNADIRENRSVISRTNEGMKELEGEIYKKDLFPTNDFTKKPRHIQFSEALLREARVSEEQCQVSEDVRQALDEVNKVKGLMDIMTNPLTPMSTRLKLQDKYLWPKVEELLKKDIEDKKRQKKEEGDSNQDDDNDEKIDPNKAFEDDYKEVEDKLGEAVPFEDIEKAFKEWKNIQDKKDSKDKADADYAEKIGVEKKNLQNYRKIVEEINKIANPETDISLIEELRSLFNRIISKRLKIGEVPKYPVEEGDEIVDPALLVAEVKSGNLEPKVWESTEIKEKKGDKFGEVEITIVCDRSSSMQEGQKAVEQRKSVVLVMEVLKEFAELCEAEKINMDKPLSVKSEIYSFAGSEDDKTPLKKMSAELGESERINVLKRLYDLPGSTTDFNCLETICGNLDENTKTRIKNGELKKIVIVFTDGDSDDSNRVSNVLKSLRGGGAVIIGVGMTKEGNSVLSTYAPNALVVEDVSKLTLVLGALLRDHLKDL